MSIKSTRTIPRQRALTILLSEIPSVSNTLLGDLLDTLAESGESHYASVFDNFIVSDFGDEEV